MCPLNWRRAASNGDRNGARLSIRDWNRSVTRLTTAGQTGEIIENPIISNFKDGLTVLEYFISTHGARKGLADTALKTADAGYLTRRLVDVVQDVVVHEEDCGTSKGIAIDALREGDEVMEPLSIRILGRFAQEDIYDPVTEDLICPINTLIDEQIARKIEDAGIETVLIRSILTCDSISGVCKRCYGRNLAMRGVKGVQFMNKVYFNLFSGIFQPMGERGVRW